MGLRNVLLILQVVMFSRHIISAIKASFGALSGGFISTGGRLVQGARYCNSSLVVSFSKF